MLYYYSGYGKWIVSRIEKAAEEKSNSSPVTRVRGVFRLSPHNELDIKYRGVTMLANLEYTAHPDAPRITPSELGLESFDGCVLFFLIMDRPHANREWRPHKIEIRERDIINEAEQRQSETQAVCGNRWPWGNHETELLRKLAVAAEEYWSTYNPNNPKTAPTNEEVIEWLKGQGVSNRIAIAMATILRADGLPTGPRK